MGVVSWWGCSARAGGQSCGESVEQGLPDCHRRPPTVVRSRHSVDRLKKSERANLFFAARYRVEQVGPIQFRAVNVPTGAEFHVTEVFGRFHRVISNTGGDHLLYLGE